MRNSNWAVWRWLERSLALGGLACVAWAGFVSVQARAYQRTHREAFLSREATPAPGLGVSSEPADRPVRGSTLGLLEIPRLGFSEVVAEGDDDSTLRVAIGHLPDTPLPWAAGNSVLAGHRDTHFRALREIIIGDQLRLKTPRGTFDYRVQDKMIVSPEDVWVLAPAGKRRLTLVTCYPFSYVGRAPQRFIVKADETTTSSGKGTPRSTLSN